jgi:hypothetical protein
MSSSDKIQRGLDKLINDLMVDDLLIKDPASPMEETAKIFNIPVPVYVKVGTARAIEIHIDNMILTYGKDVALQHLYTCLAKKSIEG